MSGTHGGHALCSLWLVCFLLLVYAERGVCFLCILNSQPLQPNFSQQQAYLLGMVACVLSATIHTPVCLCNKASNERPAVAVPVICCVEGLCCVWHSVAITVAVFASLYMAVPCCCTCFCSYSTAGLLPLAAQSLLLIVMLPCWGDGSVAPGLSFAPVLFTAGS